MKESNRPYTPDELKTAKDSIISSIPFEGRSAEEYIHQLGIRREDLDGKRVLDLGAGSEITFARELPSQGIQAEVISYSPAFIDGKIWGRDGKRKQIPERLVVEGMAEELRFANNSFDTVVMFYVTIYFNRDERMAATLSEIVRVLKPEGVAYIGPIFDYRNEEVNGIDRSRRWLDQEKVIQFLQGKAEATWEKAPNVPAGHKALTLRIVKNKE